MPFCNNNNLNMLNKLKTIKLILIFSCIILISKLNAEEEEIYLKSISDQIQVITKDLKTLEKAVYQKSDVSKNVTLNAAKNDGLNEDILTKHLLKLNEIEDQFRELTNKFEEVNFKLDKLSNKLSKVQEDNQLRFEQIEQNSITNLKNNSLSSLPQTNQALMNEEITQKKYILDPQNHNLWEKYHTKT